MLSNAQKSRLKAAQRQAGIDDAEYREWIETIAGPGVHSSTDPKVDNRAWDKLMAQFEAIYWLKVERGELQHSYNPKASFQKKGYWAQKNTSHETSRDRFSQAETVEAIISLETELTDLGNHPNYLAAIRNKVTQGRADPKSLWAYRAALERTLAGKKQKLAA
jgi:hypothetical protein